MSNRKELINKFAKKANVPKRNAAMYLGILLEVIQLILARTGTFAPGVRVSFKPGRPLKETVENGNFIRARAKKAGGGNKAPKRKK
ncbi:MAG: hypothetical protein JRI45_10655 [Deltaproteobacteria bacterium]|nr:hypothetical protein [Deltaproteobacteria bacterium]